jgi:tetraprenyl-beta-curcumene synthase
MGMPVEGNSRRRGLALVGLVVSFFVASVRYWLGVFPRVCLERRHRRARALQIPDPLLRRVALEAQRKWGNVEGAAAFATFVPRRRRATAARATMCLQEAYNYLDMLGEQPSAEPAANGRALHRALLVALDPGAAHGDYYAHCPQREDGGYLRALVEDCRAALSRLPSYEAVMPAASRAAERIVEFQSCNTGERQGDLRALERWARALTPPGFDLRWWEVAAAGGSSLCLYALIALAAESELDLWAPSAVTDAYFPWIGALHSLLDTLVDAGEDRATGQHSLIGAYASPQEAAARMRRLAERSHAAAQALPGGRAHTLLLAAMASFYLCTPEASAPEALPVRGAVLDALGAPAALTMVVFRARLAARRLAPRARSRRARGAELVLPTAPAERGPARGTLAGTGPAPGAPVGGVPVGESSAERARG